MGPPTAGDVGLGQHGELRTGEDATPFERADLDGQVEAPIAEQVAQALGRTLAVGGDDDPVALALEVVELADERLAVADDRVPAGGGHGRDVGAVGRDGHGPHGQRPRPVRRGEQRLELGVQPGEAPVVADLPGPGQRGGEVVLLGQQVGGPVPQAAGLDDDDEPVGGHQVDDGAGVVDEPRQPALHAVEDLALGQPLPLLASPRLVTDQLLGAGPHGIGREQLPAREDLDALEVAGGALVAHRERGEAVDLVAPLVEADRGIGGGVEHVDDGAAHGELAPVLDLGLAPVAVHAEPGGEVVEVVALPRPDHERFDRLDVGTESLHERPHGCDDHGGSAFGVAEPPRGAQPAALGLQRR